MSAALGLLCESISSVWPGRNTIQLNAGLKESEGAFSSTCALYVVHLKAARRHMFLHSWEGLRRTCDGTRASVAKFAYVHGAPGVAPTSERAFSG